GERAREVRVDPVVRGPAVDRAADAGDCHVTVTAGHAQPRPGQEEAARPKVVGALEGPYRGSVAEGERRERVPGTDEVGTGRDSRPPRPPVPREERALRRGAGDPVDGEAERALEAAHRALRPPAEVAVQVRRREAAPGEQELEHGDVPADPAAGERARAEERPAEPSEP